VNKIVHYFLIDFRNDFKQNIDSGYYYKIGVAGGKEEILSYLESVSNDVRYIESKDKPHKKEIGKRKLPCGTVVMCKYFGDKVGTFSTFNNQEYKLKLIQNTIIDRRHNYRG
jgi:hypothetical protein